MKFALLGWAPEGLPFLRAVTADSRHSLVAAAEVPDEGLGRLLETAPGIRVLGDWDELLLDAAADVTLVAGASEATLAGARQLAVDGRPLALLPQAGQGSAFIYELSLTHDDNQVPLVPIPRLEVHPLSRQLKRLVETGELGQLILLRLERKIPSRQPTAGSSPHGGSVEPGSSVSLTAGEVDAAFLDDVALLRYLAGNFNRITAVHSGSDDTQITLATITLGGDELAEATWTAQRGHPAWQLEVTGTDASATLTLSSDWSGTLETAGGSDAHGTDGGGSDAGGSDARGTDGGGSDADGSKPAADSEWKSARDAKHSSVGTGVLEAHDTTSRVDDDDGASLGAAQLTAVEESLKKPVSAWTELTRTFETVEATRTSLRRRRTIDLFFETTSERSIFKSQMSAVGCGLILLTLFGLVAFLVVGAFLDSRTMLQRKAEADNRVIHDSEFVDGRGELNEYGRGHLREIAREVEQSAETILVMPADEAASEEMNQKRLRSVIAALRQAGHEQSDAFVKLASRPHSATVILLNVLRILWIAPLVFFLILQLLVFVTRPSSHEESGASRTN